MAKTKKKKQAARRVQKTKKTAKKTAKVKSSAAAKKKAVAQKGSAKKKSVRAKKAAPKKVSAKKKAPKKVAAKRLPAKKSAKRMSAKPVAKTPAPKKAHHVNEDVENKARALIFAEREEAHHRGRPDGGQAFVNEKDGTSSDEMAEEMARDFLTAAETGVEKLEELSDEEESEETGGPFVETSGDVEFAAGTDASNPEDADREPFPTANRK